MYWIRLDVVHASMSNERSCGTVTLMVLGQFSDICGLFRSLTSWIGIPVLLGYTNCIPVMMKIGHNAPALDGLGSVSE